MFSVLVDGHLFLSRRLLLMLTIGGKKKTPSEVIVKQSSCGGVLTVLLKSKHDSGNKVTHYLRPHPDPLISLEEVKY